MLLLATCPCQTAVLLSSNERALCVFLPVCLCSQGARVYTDRWIGVWFSNIFNQSLAFYLGIYFALGVAYSLITFAR